MSDTSPPNTTTSGDTTAPGAASGHTGATNHPVPVRLARKPVLTESAVGTAPPLRPTDEDITVTIDGREVKAKKGQLIIDVADQAGSYIPRFCYHPRMKPVGMCRMCLVEVQGPRGATLMPACYNPVSDGMQISTTSEMTKKAQDGVLEFLLVNHPLDCPVCDKGGECPLQDQTLAYGPGESRFVEEKRHWEKPIPISELVNLDRERCIQCGRCVRFADEVAGDPLIDFYERGDKTEVAVFADSNPFSSYFSGNIVQICPVGALTATPYRFRARPWDLEQVESSCTSCSIGCRSAVQASSDELVRTLGVDNDPVNWSWLCDKGRFDYQAVNSDERVTVPLVRKGDELVEVSWAEALTVAAEGLVANRPFGTAAAVIGGARLPNEDAYAWSKLARVGLHTDHVDAQLGDGLPAEVILGAPRATIDEAASASLVITLAGDIKDELPVLYLRLRNAAREHDLQICELTPASTGLSREAAVTLVYEPGAAADLAAALTATDAPTDAVAGVSADDIAAVRAHIDRAQGSVVVVLGRPSLAESEASIAAAAHTLAGIDGVKFLSALRRSNVHGALDLGLAPGVLPGRVSLEAGREYYEHHWGVSLPAAAGLDTAGILAAAARGRVGALVLLGADPATDFPDAALAAEGLAGARFVVAVDTFLTASSRQADVVLPAATYAERRGTFTNLEGRISHLGAIVTAPGVAWPDWMIASELGWRLGVDLGFTSVEEIWQEISTISPLHQGVSYAALTGAAGSDGVVVPFDGTAPTTPARPRFLDPMADPGIASADLHSWAPTSIAVSVPPASVASDFGLDELPGAGTPVAEASEVGLVGAANDSVANAEAGIPAPVEPAAPAGEDAPGVPAPLAGIPSGAMSAAPVSSGAVPPVASGAVPPVASGDTLTLITRRVLWDAGTLVTHSPGLAGLSPDWAARIHPDEVERLGLTGAELVTVTSAKGSVTLDLHADVTVPAGRVSVPFNLAAGSSAALIDSAAPATTVTVAGAPAPTTPDAGGDS